MKIFIIAVTALAVMAVLASVIAITPVVADQNPNRHGLEVSGVAQGHGEDVSVLTDLDGRLPGGGCRVVLEALTQGGDVSEVARDLEIDTTD